MYEPKDNQESSSPIGATVEGDDEQWAMRDCAYYTQRGAQTLYREIAWLLINYRMDHGLTQQQLAKRVGTSSSQISRIERDRQRTNLDTLLHIAHEPHIKVELGFTCTSRDGNTERRIVAL